jgi:hypothetical protein
MRIQVTKMMRFHNIGSENGFSTFREKLFIVLNITSMKYFLAENSCLTKDF